ncbi:Retrovirus-related Pol polyprotein [Stylophora pistillata]|uniref:Retrovirus-related Pol polyprotein n=1 Tax=Stylophora pistillata TaxID=50429 RepID=A0A2B4S809_STYPI|nr:Retrovirus-related Pol polyprotein [Stylophora pistillata]
MRNVVERVCCASTVEGKLLNNIMKDYNKKARPVINETDVVHISMDIALPQLMKVLTCKECFTISIFWLCPIVSWQLRSLLPEGGRESTLERASCNFQEKDRMIRAKIVFSFSGKLQELLLRETSLDLKKAIEICGGAFEITSRNTKEMNASSEAQKIDKVGVQSRSLQKFPMKPQREYTPRILKECKFCGKSHEAVKTKCPAWGKTCKYCKGRNHFGVKCKKVHSLNAESDLTDSDEQWLANVVTDQNKAVTALMHVNSCEVRFQLDSRDDVNTICQKFVKKSQVKPPSQKLIMWNKSKLIPLGKTTLELLNPKDAQRKLNEALCGLNGVICVADDLLVMGRGNTREEADADHEQNLPSDLQPIRELTRKNAEWNWSIECEEAFQRLKQNITDTPVLAYFDPDKELVLQVDSGKDGLGSALLQDGKPIEYASQALTSAERN